MAQSSITVKIEGIEALERFVARLEQLTESMDRLERATHRDDHDQRRGAGSAKRNRRD